MAEILWITVLVLLCFATGNELTPQIVFLWDTSLTNENVTDNLNISSLANINLTTSHIEVDTRNSFQTYQTDTLQVPFISVYSECTNVHTESKYIHFIPDHRSNKRLAVTSVLDELGWEEVAYVHDETDDDVMYSALSAVNATVQTFRVRSTHVRPDVTEILKKSRASAKMQLNFMATCGDECIRELLTQANTFERTEDDQATFTFTARWLLIGDRHLQELIAPLLGAIDNVLLLVPGTQKQDNAWHNALSAVDCVIDALKELLSFHSVSNVTARDDAGCARRLRLATLLSQQLQTAIDIVKFTNTTGYERYTALWGPRQQRRLAKIPSAQDGAVSVLMPNTVFGLNNRVLRIGTVEWFPFLEKDESASSGYSGLCMELILELSRNLNFSFELIQPDDGGWGAEDTNGSWSGLIGQLVKKKVDIVVAPIVSTPQREMFVDFTVDFYVDYSTVLMRYPDVAATRWRLFLRPFSWVVWLMLALVVPFSGWILWLFSRYSPFYTPKQAKVGLGNADNAFLYTFGALFTQGGIFLPEAQSGRFFVGFYWMSCIVIVATYSGNLIAYLTVTKTEVPVDTLREVANQDQYKLGYLGGVALAEEFKISRNPVYNKVQSKVMKSYEYDPSVTSTNHSLHIERVLSSNYAYISYKTGFELAMSKHCDIDMIKEEFEPSEYAAALQNNSAYLSIFNNEITIIKESGLVNKWKAKWWPRQIFCSRGLVTEAKQVTVEDVQGAYYLVAIAVTLAAVTLFVEGVFTRSKGVILGNTK